MSPALVPGAQQPPAASDFLFSCLKPRLHVFKMFLSTFKVAGPEAFLSLVGQEGCSHDSTSVCD